MARLKRPQAGFTLLELVIAMTLAAVVLLSATNLMVHFGKFSANTVKAEASLMGSAMGTFEEIAARISGGNQATITAGGSSIQIRVDTNGTPSDYTNDTLYTYWLNGTNLMRTGVTGDSSGKIIANDISSLSFVQDGTFKNRITVTLEAQAASGATGAKSKEHLETTVTMQARSGN